MPATALQVPSEFVTKWQEIVDLLAEIIRVATWRPTIQFGFYECDIA